MKADTTEKNVKKLGEGGTQRVGGRTRKELAAEEPTFPLLFTAGLLCEVGGAALLPVSLLGLALLFGLPGRRRELGRDLLGASCQWKEDSGRSSSSLVRFLQELPSAEAILLLAHINNQSINQSNN